MDNQLFLYNSLTRKKEQFSPINPPMVGLYVCGPTVYGHPHLGHARPAVTYDVLFRYLTHLGYKVRYVRNVTDVGHLENEAGEGDDKIAKRAKLEAIEPMEVVHKYTESYHEAMRQLNVLSPSIEPRATGHIIEQIELIKNILNNGFAYEINGSVYFDVMAYHKKHHYGKLSGRKVEDLLSNTRTLDGQDEKRSSLDFALWKKAKPEHIMRWPSPWSDGFPGWHLECTAMSTKYLGETFDIHGGGMDLLFPHHECEIAQSVAGIGHESVKHWMHNNMITINGQKMGKSLGNFITLDELFSGQHDLLEMEYSPMTIRFFMLQAQYRGTLDFSNEALQAAQKGLDRLLTGVSVLAKLPTSDTSTVDISPLKDKLYAALNDDLNTPVLIANLFDCVKMINAIHAGNEQISAQDKEALTQIMTVFCFDILGLEQENETGGTNNEAFASAIDLLLSVRKEAKENKNWALSDKIRDELAKLGFQVKDTKDGFEWTI